MNTKKILFFTVCLCISMLAQAQIKLSFNPTEGKTYLYSFNSEQSIKQTVMGQEMPLNTAMEMLIEMSVKEKSKDEIRLNFLYKGIIVEFSHPMMNIRYDSENPADNSSEPEKLIAQIFSNLVGKPMSVTFRSDGSVKSISGLDAIWEGMQKSMASANPAAQQATSAVLQSFNEESMKQMFEQSFKMYPENEVKVGNSWYTDMSFNIASMINNTRNTYTLKSVENNIALLDMVSVSNMKLSMGMEGEISGKHQGEVSLDIKTGMLINSAMEGSAKGGFDMQGMEISMDITSKVKMSLQQ